MNLFIFQGRFSLENEVQRLQTLTEHKLTRALLNLKTTQYYFDHSWKRMTKH